MTFVVVGEGEPAHAVLRMLCESTAASVVALFTRDPLASRLVNFALSQDIPVRPSDSLSGANSTALGIGDGIDWLLSVNNTSILPLWLLKACRRGALNLHPGLLPEYAGLHTHQWAIRNCEKQFGSTIHFMEAKVDTGPIVRQRRFPLRSSDTGITVFKRCQKIGVELLRDVIGDLLSGRPLVSVPQDLSKRVVYRHRDNLDGRIDWNWTSIVIDAFVRAANYEPFTSPSYVPCLDRSGDLQIEVLQAQIKGAVDKVAGSILGVTSEGLCVASGAGSSVCITRARSNTRSVDSAMWYRYADQLPDGRLRGRLAGTDWTEPVRNDSQKPRSSLPARFLRP
jgi:methionyl-tRNA formyltransferase